MNLIEAGIPSLRKRGNSSMFNLKKVMVKAVCCGLLLSLLPVTGCSKFKEIMESQASQKEEDEQLKFDDEKDFERFYSKEIGKAMKDNDKDALEALFCSTVTDNTADLNEGIEYVMELDDWSGCTCSARGSTSYQEYGGGYRWRYVYSNATLKSGDAEYRLYFSGFAYYYIDSKNSKENTGLTNLCIVELDSKGKEKDTVYNVINGINHPGREDVETIVNTVLNTKSSTNSDGSYIDTMTDEALASIMSPELLNSADEDELEAFYRFIRLDQKAKKHGYFFFLDQNGSDIILTADVHLYKIGDHCLKLLIEDGRIAGAVLGDESNLGNPKSGRINGFDGVIE